MKTRYLLIASLIICLSGVNKICLSQPVSYLRPRPQLLDIIKQNLKEADAQYKILTTQLTPGRFPKSFNPANNKLENK